MRSRRNHSAKIKIIPLIFLGIVFYLLTVYSPFIKNIVGFVMNTSSSVVLGEKIVPAKETDSGKMPPFKERVKADVVQSLDSAKETGLQLRIGDIVNSVGRLKKVADDARNVGDWLKDSVKKAAEKK